MLNDYEVVGRCRGEKLTSDADRLCCVCGASLSTSIHDRSVRGFPGQSPWVSGPILDRAIMLMRLLQNQGALEGRSKHTQRRSRCPSFRRLMDTLFGHPGLYATLIENMFLLGRERIR